VELRQPFFNDDIRIITKSLKSIRSVLGKSSKKIC